MIKLGDRVRDTVSGFEGVAVARYSYLQGCHRICVQPPVDDDGKLPKTENFDEPQLITVDDLVASAGSQLDGGPEKYLPLPKTGD